MPCEKEAAAEAEEEGGGEKEKVEEAGEMDIAELAEGGRGG